MATITLPPPQAALVIMDEGLAQGLEGRFLEEATQNVFRHWKMPAELFMEEENEAEELAYRSVPMEQAFTVRVKYRYVGELKPRPYPLDE